MRLLLVTSMVVGCGNDVGLPAVDAAGIGGPPGSPSVTVTAPRSNESFYPMQTAQVTWTATDENAPITCDVSAVGTTSIPIASEVSSTSATITSTTWSINGAAAGGYRIQVACTDANDLTGVGQSATFQVSAPPENVSYATQIQPLWNASCTSMACHDAMVPAEGLNLTASASHAELAMTSMQCGAYKLVEPGAPERSYLVMKLQGSGPCYMPTRMPKGVASFSIDKLQLVRDWIYNGAPAN